MGKDLLSSDIKGNSTRGESIEKSHRTNVRLLSNLTGTGL